MDWNVSLKCMLKSIPIKLKFVIALIQLAQLNTPAFGGNNGFAETMLEIHRFASIKLAEPLYGHIYLLNTAQIPHFPQQTIITRRARRLSSAAIRERCHDIISHRGWPALIPHTTATQLVSCNSRAKWRRPRATYQNSARQTTAIGGGAQEQAGRLVSISGIREEC